MRQLERTGTCTACGYAVRLHYDASNRMIGCAGAARLAPLDKGRLLQLKLQRNDTARQEALGTIRLGIGGKWAVKLGGRQAGHWYTFVTRLQAERAVETYYNEAAIKLVLPLQEKDDGDTERRTETTSPE